MAIVKSTGGAKEAGLAAGISQALGDELQEKKAKEMAEFESNLKMDYEKRKAALQNEIDLATEVRAHAWDIKRMEASADIDFRQREKSRLKKREKAGSQADAIQKSLDEGVIGPNDANYQQVKDRLEYCLYIKETGEEPPVSLYTTKSADVPWYADPQNLKNPIAKAMILEQIQPGLSTATPEEQAEFLSPELREVFGLQEPDLIESELPEATVITPEIRQKQAYDEYSKKTIEAENIPMTFAQWQQENPIPEEIESPYGKTAFQLAGVPFPGRLPATPAKPKPIVQRNKRTEQKRISYDGGLTWEIQ